MLSELERKNMSKLLQRYSLEHLRPSPQVYQIIISCSRMVYSEEELFLVSGKDRRRRIYYKVDYEPQEIQAIEELKEKLRNEGLDHAFGDQILLKHLYAGKWSTSKAAQRIRQLHAFHTNQEITRFDNTTIANLQLGQAYCYGHDRCMRPNVIMRVDKIDFRQPIQDTFNSFYYMMLVVLGYKMVPYHAEKYNLIMDFNNISLSEIPYSYLYESLEKVGIYYCGNTQKTFLFNSEGISTIWKMVSFFLPQNQKKRIIFINKGEEKAILQYIDQYELEKKYGGKLPNLTTFWPPKNTNEQFDVMMGRSKIDQSYYSVQNNEEYFDDVSNESVVCSSANCQCNIY